MSVDKEFLFVRTKDLQVERFNLKRKSKSRDRVYNFEDGFMEVSQFDVDRFGYEVVGITEEGSFQLMNRKSKPKVVDILKKGNIFLNSKKFIKKKYFLINFR